MTDHSPGIAVNKKCMECQESFPGSTIVCPHDGSQLATTLVRSAVGARLSERYEILDEIGRGGMGVIYKALDKLATDQTKAVVAIKLLINDAGSNDTVRARFMVEARAASSLSHPNIIKVHEFAVSPEGLPFMVMEYLDGVPLDDLIETGGMETAELLQYVIEVCDALAHAHRRNIIHRDIKPSNIMIVCGDDNKGKAIVVDFGIAKIFAQPGQTSMRLTQTGEVFGSPLYMSPEQCMGQKLDQRSDIYALGCLVYECLTGESPFHGENFLNVIFQHVNNPPKPFAKQGTDFLLEPIVLKALEKKPENRYQSMVEFRQALEHCRKILCGAQTHDTANDAYSDDADTLSQVKEQAEAGDANAQFDLGLFFQYGTFSDPDEELGFEWCLKAAKQGLARAQLAIADMYHYGWGVEIDLGEALHWYQAAAGQDQAEAMSALATMYDCGEGVESDPLMAEKWYLQAAERENITAQLALGHLYRLGITGSIEPDLSQSAKWFIRAAQQGDAESQVNAGVCYWFAEGVEKDYEIAFEWFQLSADQGHCEGQRFLSFCYDEGKGVMRNSFEALRWMTEAARNGDGPAHTWLGYWHMNGDNDLPIDLKKAISYFRQGSELGDYLSHVYLGDCYFNGSGVARSERTAVHWYKSGAQAGNAASQHRLATCYRDGTGIEKDEKLFMKWIRRAAEQSEVEAQYELGMHYKKLRKFNNATKWLKLALDLGCTKAKKPLEAIERERGTR